MASAGYPGTYENGKPIHGCEKLHAGITVFHAGTQRREGVLLTAGGRVLGVTAIGDTLKDAQSAAYKAVDLISFEGAQFRRDIAAKGLAS